MTDIVEEIEGGWQAGHFSSSDEAIMAECDWWEKKADQAAAEIKNLRSQLRESLKEVVTLKSVGGGVPYDPKGQMREVLGEFATYFLKSRTWDGHGDSTMTPYELHEGIFEFIANNREEGDG